MVKPDNSSTKKARTPKTKTGVKRNGADKNFEDRDADGSGKPVHGVEVSGRQRRRRLMQAIARVNRVYGDKAGGLVVETTSG